VAPKSLLNTVLGMCAYDTITVEVPVKSTDNDDKED
jgi:hypothetical protein